MGNVPRGFSIRHRNLLWITQFLYKHFVHNRNCRLFNSHVLFDFLLGIHSSNTEQKDNLLFTIIHSSDFNDDNQLGIEKVVVFNGCVHL